MSKKECAETGIPTPRLRAAARAAYAAWQADAPKRAEEECKARFDNLAYVIWQTLGVRLVPDHDGHAAHVDGLKFVLAGDGMGLRVRQSQSMAWHPCPDLVALGRVLKTMEGD